MGDIVDHNAYDVNNDNGLDLYPENLVEEISEEYHKMMMSNFLTSDDPLPKQDKICSQKRKIGTECSASTSNDNSDKDPRCKKICLEKNKEKTGEEYSFYLLSLPREILEHILKFFTYGEMSKIRSVCHLFNQICQATLNTTFQRLQTSMQQKCQRIKSQMPRRESARRKHPLARQCDIIETLHMRLTLLQMTFGKHVDKGHCCFFPGEILDEVQRILHYVKSTPNLGRAYKVTDELFDLSTMAMEYFKEHVEPILPEIKYFSTDFPEYSPIDVTEPSPRLFMLHYNETPKGTSTQPAETVADSSQIEKGQNQQGSSDQTPNSCLYKKNMRTFNSDVSILKKELKTCKNKIAHQQKQTLEANNKLEQQQRQIEEQNKKLDALVKEMHRCKTELKWHRDRHFQMKMCHKLRLRSTLKARKHKKTANYCVSKNCEKNAEPCIPAHDKNN